MIWKVGPKYGIISLHSSSMPSSLEALLLFCHLGVAITEVGLIYNIPESL